MGNTAPKSSLTADIERLTDLDSPRLAKLDKRGILSPSTPGVQGSTSRQYDTAHTVAAMVVGDFRRRLGIDRERQLAPIVRAIIEQPGFKGRGERADGAVRLEYADFPRWLAFDGGAVVTSDEFPMLPWAMVVDLHSYLARLFLLTELQSIEPKQRLKTLLKTGLEGQGPGVREAKRYALDILEGRMPLDEAARRLGVTEDDIRIERMALLAAK